MKRVIGTVCLLLTCVLLLASCGAFDKKPRTAEELWARIDERMQAFDAYVLEQEMEMTVVQDGYAFVTTGKGVLAEDRSAMDSDYYFYSDASASVKCEELEIEQSMREISAYMNRKGYKVTDDRGFKRKLFCKMTAEEFLAYNQEGNDLEDVDFLACTQKAFTQNEDGSLTLTFAGYTGKAVHSIVQSLGAQSIAPGTDIIDMQVVFEADAEYNLTDVEFSFVFDAEDAETAPSMRIALHVKELGSVSRISEEDLPFTFGCTEVDSFTVLTEIEDALAAYSDAEGGTFARTTMQIRRYGGGTYEYTEEMQVEYATVQGKYTYDIVGEGSVAGKSDVIDVSISYQNNTQSITSQGQSASYTQTDEQARAYIATLINDPTNGFLPSRVTQVKKLGGGRWEIVQAVPTVDAEPFVQIMESMGATYGYAEQTVRVTILDGKLVSINTGTVIYGTLQGKSLTYSIIAENEFS